MVPLAPSHFCEVICLLIYSSNMPIDSTNTSELAMQCDICQWCKITAGTASPVHVTADCATEPVTILLAVPMMPLCKPTQYHPHALTFTQSSSYRKNNLPCYGHNSIGYRRSNHTRRARGNSDKHVLVRVRGKPSTGVVATTTPLASYS